MFSVSNFFMEILFFIIGLIFGSFANVCIYRIPNGLSVLSPNSFCPACKKRIKWYDNIPVLSYIILGGHCRNCGTKISVSYPLVELSSGLVFLFVFVKFGFSLETILFIFFGWSLLVVSVIDFYHRIIPDVFSFLLIGLGVLTSPLNTVMGYSFSERLLNSAAGATLGVLLGLAVSYFGEKVFKKEAFGGGDIKLLAGCGAFLGARAVFWTLFYASLSGSVVAGALIMLKRIKKDDYIPFGPFIALAAIFLLLF